MIFDEIGIRSRPDRSVARRAAEMPARGLFLAPVAPGSSPPAPLVIEQAVDEHVFRLPRAEHALAEHAFAAEAGRLEEARARRVRGVDLALEAPEVEAVEGDLERERERGAAVALAPVGRVPDRDPDLGDAEDGLDGAERDEPAGAVVACRRHDGEPEAARLGERPPELGEPPGRDGARDGRVDVLVRPVLRSAQIADVRLQVGLLDRPETDARALRHARLLR